MAGRKVISTGGLPTPTDLPPRWQLAGQRTVQPPEDGISGGCCFLLLGVFLVIDYFDLHEAGECEENCPWCTEEQNDLGGEG